jgi:hypothetical protein
MRNLAANNYHLFLCHALVRICQSHPAGKMLRRATLPPKPLILQNGWLIPHDDPTLIYSDCICITFKMQKQEEKDDTATQMALGDITLCPIRAATAIVSRIHSYAGANDNTPISATWKYDCIEHINSNHI